MHPHRPRSTCFKKAALPDRHAKSAKSAQQQLLFYLSCSLPFSHSWQLSLRPALANYCGTQWRRARTCAPLHHLTRLLLLLLLLHGRPSPRSGLLRRNQIAVSQAATSGLRPEVCTMHSASLSVCHFMASTIVATRSRDPVQNAARLHEQTSRTSYCTPSVQRGTAHMAGQAVFGLIEPRVPRVGGHWTRRSVILGLSREPSRALGVTP